jgi:hypothetical protein
MEWLDVVVLEVDLDEGLPVVVAFLDFDPVEHMVREVERIRRECCEVAMDVALTVEQEAMPVGERRPAQMQAWVVGEMRRAEELALQGRRSSGGSGTRCASRCRDPAA